MIFSISLGRFSAPLLIGIAAWVGISRAGAETPFELGVKAFQGGQYDVAKTRFTEARDAMPGDVLNQLWLGLATHATGGAFDGANEWRAAMGHPRYESMAEFFRGLTYWKAGYHNDARQYFGETLFNITDGKAVDYAPGKAALADLAAGKAAPAIAAWPQLAGLPTKSDTPTPAPAAPVAPAPAPVAPPAAPPQVPGAAVPAPAVNPPPQPAQRVRGYVAWSPFRQHGAGERVLFRVANAEWRFGSITEVGNQGAFLDKYLIKDERTGATNYYYYTDVAGLERRDFWTGFFVGRWALGSGMSVNQRTEGGAPRDEILYVGSTEWLEVKADGTYVWTTADGKKIKGRWRPEPGNPGIVIIKGDRGRDYTFYNISDPATVGVMKEHHARLATEGVMTTLARRRIP